MSILKVLDCTLRDGGYINNWEFGQSNIKKIIKNLVFSEVDIVECGFLSNKKPFTINQTQFTTITEMAEYLPKERKNTKFVCMINYGEYKAADVPRFDGKTVDGIRIAFHKKDLVEVISFAKELSTKGYLLFLQPMVTINYTDMELIDLVKMTNELKPYAFYIVDSFGVMKQNDLTRMFYLVDNNLDKDIHIGYHSHNNLQLAYSNAQSLTTVRTKRTIIIDASVFGMGRGAGNLNTELFLDYLNTNYDSNYKIYPLLQIIDEVLNNIYSESYWGYSLSHYLSATYNCHPNYASYLDGKNTLTVKAVSDILRRIEESKKSNYDKTYIEELYLSYQKHNINDQEAVEYLFKVLEEKDILLLAPGSSIGQYQDQIREYINKNKSVVISINFISDEFSCDYAFISNLKRFETVEFGELLQNTTSKIIITSNIKTKPNKFIIVNYNDLLNNRQAVIDNSALMLLKLLHKAGVSKVTFAGFDGYSHENMKNYADKNMVLNTSSTLIEDLNKGIAVVLNELSESIDLQFITPTKYSEMLNF